MCTISSLARVLILQSTHSRSTLLQLLVKRCIRGSLERHLQSKLLKAARRRLDVAHKNQRGQTIVHMLTKSGTSAGTVHAMFVQEGNAMTH
jgi:hypothetical protein